MSSAAHNTRQHALNGHQGAAVSTPLCPAQHSLIVYLLPLQIRSLASFITYPQAAAARRPNGNLLQDLNTCRGVMFDNLETFFELFILNYYVTHKIWH